MNKIIKYFLSLILVTSMLIACEKDENRITAEDGASPTLTANRTGTIPLAFASASEEAIRLNWTNPNYRFSTGVSSHDVNYQIEIDTAGANFTNPKRQTISISNELGVTWTQAQFNDYLLNQLELVPGMSHTIQIRVRSAIGTGSLPLYSNVLEFTTTPYAIPPKVTPPASGELYIVGNATPGDWNNPVPVPSQKFTQVSPTLYEITLQLNANNSYLFLPVNGSWDAKYGYVGGNNENNVNGDDFKAQGGDMKAPAVSGLYKIEVNFQTGKFKVTPA